MLAFGKRTASTQSGMRDLAICFPCREKKLQPRNANLRNIVNNCY